MSRLETLRLQKQTTTRPVLLLDQDGILADTNAFLIDRLNIRHKLNLKQSDHDRLFGDHTCLTPEVTRPMVAACFNQRGFFRDLPPIKDAIQSVNKLAEHYDIYVVTTPWVHNIYCYSEKAAWIKEHLPFLEKKVVQTVCKEVVHGHVLVDDKMNNLQKWRERWPTGVGASLKYHWTDPNLADIIQPDWASLSDTLIKAIT